MRRPPVDPLRLLYELTDDTSIVSRVDQLTTRNQTKRKPL